MILKSYPDLIFGVPDSDVYLFTIAARNGDGAAAPQLTLAQIEAARQAAAAVLELLGVEVETTSSVFAIDVAPNEEPGARLVFRATIENSEPASVDDAPEPTVEESAPTIPGDGETSETLDEIEVIGETEPTVEENDDAAPETTGA